MNPPPTTSNSPSACIGNPFDLHGKVAVLVAAGGRIGRAVAASFARAGASLVLADLDTVGLALLEKDETLKHTEFICREVDVRSSESIDALFAAAMERFHKIDIVVNMAFTNVFKPLREMSDEEFQLTMDVCLGGSFRISRTALRHMILQQMGGSLIHFSSIAPLPDAHPGPPAVVRRPHDRARGQHRGAHDRPHPARTARRTGGHCGTLCLPRL